MSFVALGLKLVIIMKFISILVSIFSWILFHGAVDIKIFQKIPNNALVYTEAIKTMKLNNKEGECLGECLFQPHCNSFKVYRDKPNNFSCDLYLTEQGILMEDNNSQYFPVTKPTLKLVYYLDLRCPDVFWGNVCSYNLRNNTIFNTNGKCGKVHDEGTRVHIKFESDNICTNFVLVQSSTKYFI